MLYALLTGPTLESECAWSDLKRTILKRVAQYIDKVMGQFRKMIAVIVPSQKELVISTITKEENHDTPISIIDLHILEFVFLRHPGSRAKPDHTFGIANRLLA
jgi:hypothetical protein